jgi:hypothetical protein
LTQLGLLELLPAPAPHVADSVEHPLTHFGRAPPLV